MSTIFNPTCTGVKTLDSIGIMRSYLHAPRAQPYSLADDDDNAVVVYLSSAVSRPAQLPYWARKSSYTTILNSQFIIHSDPIMTSLPGGNFQ